MTFAGPNTAFAYTVKTGVFVLAVKENSLHPISSFLRIIECSYQVIYQKLRKEKKMKRTLITSTILLIATLLLTACGGGNSNQPASPTTAPAVQNAGGGTQEVKIVNFSFTPATITVSAGTTVKWTNQDSAAHTVTADDGSFDSGQLAQGATFSFTFTKAGTFSYKCGNHPTMLGKVVVQ